MKALRDWLRRCESWLGDPLSYRGDGFLRGVSRGLVWVLGIAVAGLLLGLLLRLLGISMPYPFPDYPP